MNYFLFDKLKGLDLSFKEMGKKKTVALKQESFSVFLSQPHIAVAMIVFALIALVLAIIDFGEALL